MIPKITCSVPLVVIDGGKRYRLQDGQTVNFMHFKKNGEDTNLVPGTTHEELLTVVKDRIEMLNESLPCEENETAAKHIQLAIDALNARTRARIDQGVESTSEPHVSTSLGRKAVFLDAGSATPEETQQLVAKFQDRVLEQSSLSPRAAWPFPSSRMVDSL